MTTLVGLVGATAIALAMAANQGSGVYPDAAATVMKEANPSSEAIAAAYCGIKVSDLTSIDSPDNSDIPAKDWLPGTGPTDWNSRYSSATGTLALSDTVGVTSDTGWVGVIVRCPNGAVGTVPPT